jgi:putative flippase GtrA
MSGKEGCESLAPAKNNALLQQLGRFALVGGAAFLVNALLVELLARFTDPIRAQLIAFPGAATVAWWLNRRYTFGPTGQALHREWLRYIFANGIGALINNATYLLMVCNLAFAYNQPSIAVAAGSLTALAANFLLSRHIVFKQP